MRAKECQLFFPRTLISVTDSIETILRDYPRVAAPSQRQRKNGDRELPASFNGIQNVYRLPTNVCVSGLKIHGQQQQQQQNFIDKKKI